MSAIEADRCPRADSLVVAECRGRVMGTTFHLITVGATDTSAIDQAVARLTELEHRWSRFLTTSEISAINRAPDQFHLVSSDTARLIERGVVGWEMTQGAFDPTVLQAVIDNGYNRSFAELPSFRRDLVRSSPAPGCHDITVAAAGGDQHLVRLGAGVMFDPGGIGKGLAADIVVGEMMAAGAAGAMVNVGGDLVCQGSAATSSGWVVEVNEPAVVGGSIATFALQQGAVATSTTEKRRWSLEGTTRHHVVDPSTGHNTGGPVLATVVASDGWRAEVLATQLLVSADVNSLDETAIAALVVYANGERRWLGSIGAFLC